MGGVCQHLYMDIDFEFTVLSIHFESFNDEYAIIIEAQDTHLLIQESELNWANL